MQKQLINMEKAVLSYWDKTEDYSFDIHEFMKATLKVVKEMNRTILDLQLNQCGTCSWKKQYLKTLEELNMEDLLIIQSKINKILLKRIRGEI